MKPQEIDVEKGMHKRLMREVTSRRLMVLMGALSGVGAVAVAIGAYQVAQVVDAMLLRDASVEAVSAMLTIALAIALVRGAVQVAEGVLAGRLAARMTAHFRKMIFDALHGRESILIVREEAGELAQSVLRSAEEVSLYYAHFLPQVVRCAVIVPILLAGVVSFDPISAGILLVTIPLLPIFMALIGHLAKAKSRRQYRAMAQLGAHLYDVLAGLGTLKLFGRSREQAAVVERMSRSFATQTMQVLKVAFLSAFVLELASTLSTALAAVAIGFRLVRGEMVFAEAFWVLLLIPEVYLPLRRLGAQFHTAVVSLPAAARIYELASSVGSAVSGTRVRACADAPALVLADVRYDYGQGAVLDGVSLTVRAGCVTAIVGKSGSGKTTLLRLAANLIVPQAGRVVLDGTALDDWDAEALGREVACALQQVHLFRRSVADNIALSGTASAEEIERAARLVGADAFIRALPNGYDTMLGDGGHRLSGGEVRRMALARAFCHGGHVLLLDEWTEGLDAVTESALYRSVCATEEKRTVLMVAHRIETAMRADYVAVLDGGRIVEYGEPSVLLAQGGHWARLVESARKGADV